MLQLVREGLKAGSQQTSGKQRRGQSRATSPDGDGDSVMADAEPSAGGDDSSHADTSAAALIILQGLGTVLRQFGLRDQPDLMRLVLETACQIACSPGLPGQQPIPTFCQTQTLSSGFSPLPHSWHHHTHACAPICCRRTMTGQHQSRNEQRLPAISCYGKFEPIHPLPPSPVPTSPSSSYPPLSNSS